MEYTDAGLRLLGAFRLWNAVRYFSPNLELAEDQNIVLTEAIENMLAANDRAGYLRALQHIAAGMHDNHVHIGTKHNDTTIMVAPFNSTQFIDGKYIITNIYGDNNPLRVGDAITHRNGRTIEEFITENAYIISASNSPGLARQAGAMLNISRDQSPILLSIEREGHRMEIEVPVYSLEKFAEIGGKNYIMQGYYSSQESGFRILEDSIAYIHIGNITDADLPIDDYNKVIVDMRSYPNIDTRSLIGRLLPETAEIASFTSPDPLHPGRFNMMEGDYIPGLSTKPDRKIVVLVNEWTQSAAEYIVMMLQNNPKIYVLGSQTAGADGNVTAITLPGAMSMSFTGLGVFYPDGRPTQRVGIHIDEILRPTIESIRTGKDNIITRAVEILSE